MEPVSLGVGTQGRSSQGGALEGRLGYRFGSPELLALAMTHRSHCAENPGEASNERLEFLGDSVLGLVITDYLYCTYESLAEGEMAKIKGLVVSAEILADVAIELGLGEYLYVGKGEESSGGREKPSILADAMEAVIGAVYLDGGWDPARELVLRMLEEKVVSAAQGPGAHDHKTRLQELAASLALSIPIYDLEEDGPDHAKQFRATVTVGGVQSGSGEGRSKKQAEQAAAASAWDKLNRGLEN